MKGHGTQFGRKKEQAIAALLTARNIEEAAKFVGIAPNTLLNWMKVPEFQAAYREARRAAYSQAVAKLQQGTTAAATTLLKVMLDQGTPASVKVRAAECVMTHSAKAIEIEDIESQSLRAGKGCGHIEAALKTMTMRSLASRLQRLETRLIPADTVPIKIVLRCVDSDGTIVGTYTLTADGLKPQEPTARAVGMQKQ